MCVLQLKMWDPVLEHRFIQTVVRGMPESSGRNEINEYA